MTTWIRKYGEKLASQLNKAKVEPDDQEALEEVIKLVEEHSDCLKLIIFFSMTLKENPKIFGVIRKTLREMTETLHYYDFADNETEKNVSQEILPFALIHFFCTNESFYMRRFYEAHRRKDVPTDIQRHAGMCPVQNNDQDDGSDPG